VRGPTVTFLGGVREIGGNKILIEDGPDRILFDFGPSFAPRYEEFFVDYLKPRSTSPVRDLLEFDLLPRVSGLYSEEALTDADLPWAPPEVHGLFVSHAHADHAGYLGLVDPAIPVYVGAGTKEVLDAIQRSSPSIRYGDHAWRTVPDRQPVKVGGLEVVPFPVDHSVPFAYGYLIRTSEGTLVYTGDFRHHGPRAEATRQFLDAAAKETPIGLIIEGTRAGPDPRRDLSEEGVRKGVDRILEHHHDLALACTYPRDLDRLRTLAGAALAVGRSLVVSTRTAHLLTSIGARYPELALPAPRPEGGALVYARKKRRFYSWEEPFLDAALSAEDVRGRGGRYLLALDLAHFPELIDLRPPKGSPYIHSMSEPFSEDDVDDKVLHNWLDHFGLGFHQMHASGHASGAELGAIVRELHPRTVYPVHTEHPEAFVAFGESVTQPELGVRYSLSTAPRAG
jgi:ribonuclease J